MRCQIKKTFIHVVADCADQHMGARARARSSPPGPDLRESPTAAAPSVRVGKSGEALEEADTCASSASGESLLDLGRAETETSASSADGETEVRLRRDDVEQEPPYQANGACCFEERRLVGRERRLSRQIRFPKLGEFILSICPSVSSIPGRKPSFEKSNGVGKIQVKANEPVDMDVWVSITVGDDGASHRVEHNFWHKPLLLVPGDWDFKRASGAGTHRNEVRIAVRVESARRATNEWPAWSDTVDAPAAEALALQASSGVRAPGESAPSRPPSLRLPQLCELERTPESTPECTPRHPLAPRAPSPSEKLGGSSVLFSFSIRRAAGVKLGLEIERGEDECSLLVKSVRPGGAMDAWNRQCTDAWNGQCTAGPSSGKAVLPGDRIVSVNGKVDCVDMLEEIGGRELLRLAVFRVVPGSAMDLASSSCSAPSAECPSTPTADSSDWGTVAGVFCPAAAPAAWANVWS